MPSKPPLRREDPEPFGSAEEAWFWFIERAASSAGRPSHTGRGCAVWRPCSPADVHGVVHRLYRQRRLLRDHLAVLTHYGRRRRAPDPGRRGQQRAHCLWTEAIGRLEPALRRHGIVQ